MYDWGLELGSSNVYRTLTIIKSVHCSTIKYIKDQAKLILVKKYKKRKSPQLTGPTGIPSAVLNSSDRSPGFFSFNFVSNSFPYKQGLCW